MNGLCECGCGQPAPIATATRLRGKGAGSTKGQPLRFISGHNRKVSFVKTFTNKTHGASYGVEFHAYQNAKYRCLNPNAAQWEAYGGRGIQFLFASFEQFFAELGPRPEGMTLDRKDNDGHYVPGNVRWATPKEQRANQRVHSASNQYIKARVA